VDFDYNKIKVGNWLFRNCFPLYNIFYSRFKLRNDADEITLLEKLVKPGDHVLDIGANIGFYAKILSELVGIDGMVYCFEPDSTNFRRLVSNVGRLRNVKVVNMAVADKAGKLNVYKSKLLNVDHRTYPVDNYDSIEETESVAIDELVSNQVITRVDLIKIDIQGFELTAFKGMEELLTQNNNLKIIAEYWPHGFKRAGTSALEFFDFFTERGYFFSVINGEELLPLKRVEVAMNNDQSFEFSFNVLIEKNSG